MSDAPTDAAWLTDPTGRHAQRYFDGDEWTEHVADTAGNASTDPYDGPPAGAGASQASETIVVPSPEQPAGPAEGSAAAATGAASAGADADPTTVSGPGSGINQPDPTLAYRSGESAQSTQAGGPGAGAPPASPTWGTAAAPPPPAAAPPGAVPSWEAAPPPLGAPAAAPPWGAAPAPAGNVAPSYGQPAPPVYGAPAAPVAYGPATTGRRGMSPIGLIGALIGLALIVVGAFALKWYAAGGQTLKLSDLKDSVKHGSHLIVVTKLYFQWGIYVALAVAVVFSLLAALVRKLAAVGFILALLAGAWHFWAVFDLKHWVHVQSGITLGIQPAVWVAGAGFVVCALACLIPGRRKSSI